MAALAVLAALPAGADAAEIVLRAERPRSRPLILHVEAQDGAWQVRVLDTGGVERQRFAVPTDAPDAPPRALDADQDGAADLWLPLIAGGANTAFALWRMQPWRSRFVAAGEVSGATFTLDPAGHLVATARSGCCAVEHVFHRFGGDGALDRAFTLTRRLDPELPAAQRCTVEPGSVTPPAKLVEALCALDAEAPIPGRRLPVH
ncbi:hypothetical protein DFH01_15595 [Falsiroseomonas bella]|uniref:Uncharacterized protein n=1 Tax=Falsiroseomonas bella TaxID=2184016 RepID=A0A317FG27_9PROT|nr:hypothetical protein [Falsiroseomonas bella]PWS36568.1 hypothetical protein DFH01_15595 [Falsiroseomonas bella]